MKFIANIEVLGFTPVPWTVPNFGSGTSKAGKKFHFQTRSRKSRPDKFSPDLEKWCNLIKAEAYLAMGTFKCMVASNVDDINGITVDLQNPPVTCPVKLTIQFADRTPPGKNNGQLWFTGVKQNDKGKWVKEGNSEPDLTNLVKAVEDCLQGIVYQDDFQVRMHQVEMVYDDTPGISILVQEIEGADFPGWGDTVEAVQPSKRKRKVAHPKSAEREKS